MLKTISFIMVFAHPQKGTRPNKNSRGGSGEVEGVFKGSRRGPKEDQNGNYQPPLTTTKSMKIHWFFNIFACSGCVGTVFDDVQCEAVVARALRPAMRVLKAPCARFHLFYKHFSRSTKGPGTVKQSAMMSRVGRREVAGRSQGGRKEVARRSQVIGFHRF